MKALIAGVLAFILLASCATLAPGDSHTSNLPDTRPAWEALAPGIEYAPLLSVDPPVEAHALRIDLGTPGLELLVTDAKGGISMSQFVSSFARANACIAAINAAPFEPSSLVEGEPRKIVGLTMSRGRLISAPDPGHAVLIIRQLEGEPPGGGGTGMALRGEIGVQAEGPAYPDKPESIVAAAGGFAVVLRNGIAQGRTQKRDPRTAAGISEDGSVLYLLVADGRRKGSVGLSDFETGRWLAWLGAFIGMTLDGGGSSTMALRERDGFVRVVNQPVDGGRPGQERAVGSCLGFRLAAQGQSSP